MKQIAGTSLDLGFWLAWGGSPTLAYGAVPGREPEASLRVHAQLFGFTRLSTDLQNHSQILGTRGPSFRSCSACKQGSSGHLVLSQQIVMH